MEKRKQLFFNGALDEGAVISPEKSFSKRISRVLRLGAGAEIAVFNGDGALYQAEVLDDKASRLQVGGLLVDERGHDEKVLLVSLVKKDAMDRIYRQATEFGFTRIQPVKTDYCVVDKINADRVKSLLVEAAEQCERLWLPVLEPVRDLKSAITYICQDLGDKDSRIFWAAEQVRGRWGEISPVSGDGFLIGPEGGFSSEEKEFLSAHEKIVPVGLGDHILRADTAAAAGCALFNDRML